MTYARKAELARWAQAAWSIILVGWPWIVFVLRDRFLHFSAGRYFVICFGAIIVQLAALIVFRGCPLSKLEGYYWRKYLEELGR